MSKQLAVVDIPVDVVEEEVVVVITTPVDATMSAFVFAKVGASRCVGVGLVRVVVTDIDVLGMDVVQLVSIVVELTASCLCVEFEFVWARQGDQAKNATTATPVFIVAGILYEHID